MLQAGLGLPPIAAADVVCNGVPGMAQAQVRLHAALSLDGALGMRGVRTQLSGAAGVQYAHELRAAHDALVVGIETVRADDPQLTVRAVNGPSPTAVVLSSTLALPDSARLRSHPDLIVIGAHGRASPAAAAALAAAGIAHTVVRGNASGVAPQAVVQYLEQQGKTRILVEGGARVLASFVDAEAFDELSLELCARLLGAGAAAFGPALANQTKPLHNVRWVPMGGHILMHATRTAGRAGTK